MNTTPGYPRFLGDDMDPKLDQDGKTVLKYWRALSTTENPPKKSSFDPMEVPRALPRLMIVELRPEDNELYYRLAGTEEAFIRGFDPTGKMVKDAFFGPSWDHARTNYDYVLETGEPMVSMGNTIKRETTPVRDISLFLPMRDEADQLRFVLVYSYQRLVSPDDLDSDPTLLDPSINRISHFDH